MTIHTRIALFNAAVEIWTEDALRIYDQKNFVYFVVKPLPRAKNPLRHTTALPPKKSMMRRRAPAHPPLLRAQDGFRRRPGRIYYEDGTSEDLGTEDAYYEEDGDDEQGDEIY